MKLPILLAVITAVLWGVYGPALAQSRTALESPFKPYLMIGVAYLVWGIGGGLVGMWWKEDAFTFQGAGTFWGFIAGTLGAGGALFLTLTMFNGGNRIPHIVMPIVFGGGVTVSAFVGLWKTRAWVHASPWLYVGLAAILLGAALAAANTPQEAPPTRVIQTTGPSRAGIGR